MDFLKKLNLQEQNAGASNSSTWWSQNHSSKIASINPSNENTIAEVYVASLQDYEHLIIEAEKSFLSWRTLPAPKRGEIIRQIGEILREKKDELGSLISLETGKSKQEGDGEIQEAIDMADFAMGQSRMMYGKIMQSERPQHQLYEQWHPLGLVGVITAFNFPVAVWAWNAFIAAITGNCIIWKPSPKTPLCTLAIQHICNQVMEKNNCSGVFSCFITADNTLTEKFIEDRRVPLISFTGSSAVGKSVAEKVASRFGKCLLECSGNNAIIIDPSADLTLAIPAVVFGALGTAGQRCTSTRRLFIHESIYKNSGKQLIKAYKQVRIGDPLDSNNLMGPLIDKIAVDHYLQAISAAKSNGGRILFGGRVLNQPGYYVEPTIIEADNAWNIVQTETFSPILYLMSYKNLHEAIELQNKVKQGLSSALFTNDLKSAELFLSSMGSDCGIANINIGTSGAEIGGAFGGEKETGGGREAGSDAWQSYMRRQTNTINWSSDLPLAQGIKFSVLRDMF
jgi:aldehyde dehydrogenase (NAD+)